MSGFPKPETGDTVGEGVELVLDVLGLQGVVETMDPETLDGLGTENRQVVSAHQVRYILSDERRYSDVKSCVSESLVR